MRGEDWQHNTDSFIRQWEGGISSQVALKLRLVFFFPVILPAAAPPLSTARARWSAAARLAVAIAAAKN